MPSGGRRSNDDFRSSPIAQAGATTLAPETLELRARPQPVTRIKRKVVIGDAAVLLFLISCIVLVALKPPTLRVGDRQELFNVDHKPITDALSKLPATYDGVRQDKKTDTAKQPAATDLPPGVPKLTDAGSDPAAEAERAEKARLSRLAGQARESPILFRLQLKAPPKETVTAEPAPDPIPRPPPTTADGGLATLTALRAADRALALAGGDVDLLGTGTADQARKLSFLRSGPEKDIYNPHRLQVPASPYCRVSSSPRSPRTSTTACRGASC